uniref:Retrovirus-related Pol polyprotein from transposon TNT 1-94 n=1 Tax=Tanacetum cinerariifolium TaxID=118510 RepID=A0A699I1F1_TANCI|nr:retrovirus-related Pol polyprotein from transposon TNT 1-94 [Tanacetum cinerariifolium]
MTGAKFDIEKFNETGDFGLWRIKMHALLIQHGCEAALEGDDCSGGLVRARDFVHDKSLANKFYVKKKLYTFYMPAGRKISEHIDELNKIVLDLANIENNRKKSTGYVKKDEQPSSSDSTYANSECIVGDNRECKIRGIGKVRVQLKYGSSFVLHNVRYIPELKNLISLGTLEKEGYTVKLQPRKVKMINGSKAILSGIRRDNCVYSLDGHAMAGELNASVEEKESLAQVWHKRLGHISEAGLKVLEKQGLFGKKSLGKLNFYENCVMGKSHRVSFGVGRHTTLGVIDYVHSDLLGPSQVESLGGKRYFLLMCCRVGPII